MFSGDAGGSISWAIALGSTNSVGGSAGDNTMLLLGIGIVAVIGVIGAVLLVRLRGGLEPMSCVP
jgi:hypothetical protein